MVSIKVIAVQVCHGGELEAGIFPMYTLDEEVFSLLVYGIARLIKPRLDSGDSIV